MSIEVSGDLQALCSAVQNNCHVADAHHAQSMSLCNYLLEMREYYRWEHQLAAPAAPPRAELGRWITAREALWNSIEDEQYAPLPIAGSSFDPFATASINGVLLDLGLVYGAGIGRFHRPHFFLAELKRREVRDGVTVLISGREYARDISAAPAAVRQGTIYLRQEALQRWLWEKVEAWDGKLKEGPLQRALQHHGFDADANAAIARMTESESETLILHEIGECQAGRVLGAAWEEMLLSFSDRRAEVLCRAVRDLYADCQHTLPTLLRRGALASLHFWFASFDALRRALHPGLAKAYTQWCADADDIRLGASFSAGSAHWQNVAQDLLARYQRQGAAAQTQIGALASSDPSPLRLD